jgi:L-asparagine transporter-like permease
MLALVAYDGGFEIGAVKIRHPITPIAYLFVGGIVLYGMLRPRTGDLPSPGVFVLLYWMFIVLWLIKLVAHSHLVGVEAPFRQRNVEMPFSYAVVIWVCLVFLGIVIPILRFRPREMPFSGGSHRR